MVAPVKPRGPDFLVVGAQRTGTSWLYLTLKSHPQLWLPPIKELHYFDKLKGSTWVDPQRWRRALAAGSGILDFWTLEYFLGDGSSDWYARLFHRAQSKGRIAGEITPAYATLNEQMLRRVYQLNKDVRIIFIMRDPVQRAWSAVVRLIDNGMLRESLTLQEAIAAAKRPSAAARSAYEETISRLERVFPSSYLYFCFFDELCEKPELFVSGILSFLRVDAREAGKILRPPIIKSADAKPSPSEFQREMAVHYLPMVQGLCQRFQGAPQKWLVRYERLIAS